MAQQALCTLGWQQPSWALSPTPKVAGALGQLVQVDTQAAEAACLDLADPTQTAPGHGSRCPSEGMGDIPSQRGDVPDRGAFLRSPGPTSKAAVGTGFSWSQLDLVRTFDCYATQRKAGSTSPQGSWIPETESLPPPVLAFPGPIVGSSAGLSRGTPRRAVGRTSTEAQPSFRPEPNPLIRTSLPLTAKLRHWVITSRWQRWLFPTCCAVPYLAILLWLLSRGLIWVAQVLLAPLVMGGVGRDDPLAGQAGVPQSPP